MQALRRKRVRQGPDNVILTDQGVKRTGTPFARKDQISHERCESLTKITDKVTDNNQRQESLTNVTDHRQ